MPICVLLNTIQTNTIQNKTKLTNTKSTKTKISNYQPTNTKTKSGIVFFADLYFSDLHIRIYVRPSYLFLYLLESESKLQAKIIETTGMYFQTTSEVNPYFNSCTCRLMGRWTENWNFGVFLSNKRLFINQIVCIS